jgi:hypothetical protein
MSHDSEPRVSELVAMCKRQRQGKKHPRYDEDVKALARDLVASGVGNESLARATGVSSNAIRTWAKDAAAPKSRRRQRAVKILNVESSGGAAAERGHLVGGAAADQGRMVMMIRVADFEVAISSRDGGRP